MKIECFWRWNSFLIGAYYNRTLDVYYIHPIPFVIVRVSRR